MAVALPLSKYLMSVSQFLMGAAWLMEGNFNQKWMRLQKQWHLFLPFAVIYFVNLIGLGWTSNLTYGMHDIKVKLPILLIPFMAFTMPILSLSKCLQLLKFFVGSVFLGTLVSLFYYFGASSTKLSDVREISRFISHIRFGLMVCFSVFICFHFYVESTNRNKFLWLIGAVYFSFFLFLLQSSTAITTLLICTIFTCIYFISKTAAPKLKLSILGFSIIIFAVILILTGDVWYNSFPKPKPIEEQIIKDGRHPYFSDVNSKATENGNFIWINIDLNGMQKAWNYRIEKTYQKEKAEQKMHILLRYLTSLGLPKDSESVMALSEEQIKDIENNCTNYRFRTRFDPRYRIYETFWEWQDYQNSGNADGHSVVMRIEFLKASINIIRKNFWFGVGTGDVADSFQKVYQETESQLDKAYRMRSHNQLVTYWIAIGFLGLLVIIIAFSLWFRILLNNTFNTYLALIFALIAGLSMLNEDTLETQAGVSFIAFFATLLIMHSEDSAK
jgi:hypothetical protein